MIIRLPFLINQGAAELAPNLCISDKMIIKKIIDANLPDHFPVRLEIMGAKFIEHQQMVVIGLYRMGLSGYLLKTTSCPHVPFDTTQTYLNELQPYHQITPRYVWYDAEWNDGGETTARFVETNQNIQKHICNILTLLEYDYKIME